MEAIYSFYFLIVFQFLRFKFLLVFLLVTTSKASHNALLKETVQISHVIRLNIIILVETIVQKPSIKVRMLIKY